jgi:predicted Zn-dependent peptidase
MYVKILKNKTKYIHLQNKNNKTFTIIININIGSKHESKTQAGISHFIEHLFFGDTEKINTVEQILDKYGMEYNAFTNVENTRFYITCLNQYATIAIHIMFSMLYQNLFKDDIIERERQIVLQEYYRYTDDTDFILETALCNKLFKNGPLDSNVIGNIKTLQTINRNNIINYIKKYYRSDDIIICTSSNKPNHTTLIKQLFDNNIYKQSKYKNKPEVYKNKLQCYKQLSLKKDKIHLSVSFRIGQYNIQNNILYEYIRIILTDGLYSRLYQLLRTNNPLVYSINCEINTYQNAGVFSINIIVSKNNFKQVVTTLIKELLYSNDFTQCELDNAHNKLILQTKSIENNYKILNHYLLDIFLYTNKSYEMSEIYNLFNISIEQLNTFYKKYFNKQNIFVLFTK